MRDPDYQDTTIKRGNQHAVDRVIAPANRHDPVNTDRWHPISTT